MELEVLELWQKFTLALSHDINNREIGTTIPRNFISLFIGMQGMHITYAQLTYYIRMSIFIKCHDIYIAWITLVRLNFLAFTHSFSLSPISFSLLPSSCCLPPSLTLFEMGILIPVIMGKSSTEYTLIINYYWLEMLIISIGGPWAGCASEP